MCFGIREAKSYPRLLKYVQRKRAESKKNIYIKGASGFTVTAFIAAWQRGRAGLAAWLVVMEERDGGRKWWRKRMEKDDCGGRGWEKVGGRKCWRG